MKDFECKPQHIISGVINHIIHRIYLIDIKGIKDFIDIEISSTLKNLYSSLIEIIKITSPNKEFFKPTSFTDQIDLEEERQMSSDNKENGQMFDLNICLNLIKQLLKGSGSQENIG